MNSIRSPYEDTCEQIDPLTAAPPTRSILAHTWFEYLFGALLTLIAFAIIYSSLQLIANNPHGLVTVIFRFFLLAVEVVLPAVGLLLESARIMYAYSYVHSICIIASCFELLNAAQLNIINMLILISLFSMTVIACYLRELFAMRARYREECLPVINFHNELYEPHAARNVNDNFEQNLRSDDIAYVAPIIMSNYL